MTRKTTTTKRPRKTKRPAAGNPGLPNTLNVNGVPHELAVEIIDDAGCVWHLHRRKHILAVNLLMLVDNPAGQWLGIYRRSAREAAAAARAASGPHDEDLDLCGPPEAVGRT